MYMILVPLSEVLRMGMDDMPCLTPFPIITLIQLKTCYPREVTVEDDILKFTDLENKILKMV